MQNQRVRIVAAVVDTVCLMLYKEDGSTITIQQGDPRLKEILAEATPQLVAQNWADVNIGPTEENSYAKFEQQSNLVKFFRVAKEKLRELLHMMESADPDIQPEPALTLGTLPKIPAVNVDPQAETFTPPVNPEIEKGVEHTMNVVAEIMAHAVPASSPDFDESTVVKQRDVAVNGDTSNDHPSEDAPDTIVAVVDGKIIPGMERIKTQFARAAKLGSPQGVEKFLQRLATVIEKRSHSVDDLLKFMERGDLPIADDGSVLIYKVLRFKDREKRVYKDCHSGNVDQWIGAYVCMDEKLVDHNRNNECSNGLHVARRGYIRHFSGDVCVLAKLAPEDVITVPTYDANKMRVCGYHILAELTQKQYNLIQQNRPLTDDEDGQKLLAAMMAGKHTRKTHEVRIRGPRGADVLVTDIPEGVEPAPVLRPDAPTKAEALSVQATQVDTPIAPLDVVKTVEKISQQDQAKKLYQAFLDADLPESAAALADLKAFKKASKKSWEKLGIPTGKDGLPVVPKPGKKMASRPMPKEGETTTTGRKVPAHVAKVVESEGSPRDRIHKLLAIGVTTTAIAQSILNIKKASKKSWENLGVQAVTVQHILKLTGSKE